MLQLKEIFQFEKPTFNQFHVKYTNEVYLNHICVKGNYVNCLWHLFVPRLNRSCGNLKSLCTNLFNSMKFQLEIKDTFKYAIINIFVWFLSNPQNSLHLYLCAFLIVLWVHFKLQITKKFSGAVIEQVLPRTFLYEWCKIYTRSSYTYLFVPMVISWFWNLVCFEKHVDVFVMYLTTDFQDDSTFNIV